MLAGWTTCSEEEAKGTVLREKVGKNWLTEYIIISKVAQNSLWI